MRAVLVLVSVLASAGPAFAAAPFLTDDAVPAGHGQSELYLFSTYSRTDDGTDANLPAIEYNYGLLPDVQVLVGVALSQTQPDDDRTEWGHSDVVVGLKYRVLDETDTLPQLALAPVVILPAGDADKGLGNGKAWWRLPISLQKSRGRWTTYGGGGYVINRAAGQKNHAFGGWVLQKELGTRWTLGGEWFTRGRDTESGRALSLVNVGGSYAISPRTRVLLSAGHSVKGESLLIAYLGLWWGVGEHKHEPQLGAVLPRTAFARNQLLDVGAAPPSTSTRTSDPQRGHLP